MIRLYVCDIRTLCDPAALPGSVQKLSRERRDKIFAYTRQDDRKRSLACGLILNKVLPLYGESEKNVRLDKNGKPCCNGVEFNLSHSGSYALGAFSDKKIGCDIELIKNPPLAVARRKFTLREAEYIFSHKKEELDRAFFRIWTLKESYLKYTGEGMRRGLDFFEINPSCPPSAKIGSQLLKCRFFEYELDGHIISVCSDDEKIDGNIYRLHF